jgi:hypothetical protein
MCHRTIIRTCLMTNARLPFSSCPTRKAGGFALLFINRVRNLLDRAGLPAMSTLAESSIARRIQASFFQSSLIRGISRGSKINTILMESWTVGSVHVFEQALESTAEKNAFS